MGATEKLAACLAKYRGVVGKVVDFDAANDRLFALDLTAANTELDPDMVADTEAFTIYINKKLAGSNCRYAIGGYMEHRTIYARSAHFDTEDEPRRLHLGVDIWGDAGTPVYSPLAGIVHSFRDNDNFGDYGPTIILQHTLDGGILYSLYGHLSRSSLKGLATGQPIAPTQQIATLGRADENGHWPPHLHFQLMLDIDDAKGDYPGVGKFSEKDTLLNNIPDPALILKFSGIGTTAF
ncbi:peptidoglycan DD-metalloendopeptidase family protein [Mucilaginibacter sp. ZT4R22]|uniref:Peptidoglycan DD-metalloendopeptidase family protein n=1 Tax=Mucilaginibacter pankratovii TaxID=2772110 RepID=A0ABR7WYZ5_9SPHI|nr:peptidoglycan DD-metalloendopeptidase family protein [Mucilaginibacter pankratovii]MBD1367508.1 peptidoglycan DD-metalloendopeptidase family protein [Mucilaginibacter pankratovii]